MAETMHDPESRFQRQSRHTTLTWCHFEPTLTKNLRVLHSPPCPPCDSPSLSKLCGLSEPKEGKAGRLTRGTAGPLVPFTLVAECSI